MSKKNHAPHPIPPDNKPGAMPAPDEESLTPEVEPDQTDTGFNDQDPKRRLGNFTGAGEAPFKQPGGKNDADH